MTNLQENNEIGLRYVNDNGKIFWETRNAQEHKREKEGTYDYLSLGSELFQALQTPTAENDRATQSFQMSENKQTVYMEKYTSKNILTSHIKASDKILDRYWSLQKAHEYFKGHLLSAIKSLPPTW